MYDASIGRWHCIDPLAESYYSQSTYHFSGNNPLRFVDSDGMSYGDYYSAGGVKIGTDGIDDKKNYVVTSKSDVSNIKKNNGKVSKGSIASAVELPDAAVTDGIALAKNDSESPNYGVGDTQGGFHEEGGQYGKDSKGNTMVVPAKPGQGDEKLSQNKLSIKTTESVGFVPSDFKAEGTYHIHTAKSARYNAGGKIRVRTPKPGPSSTDIRVAGKRTSMKGNHYVVSSANGTLYIYDSSGTKATFPFSKLQEITK